MDNKQGFFRSKKNIVILAVAVLAILAAVLISSVRTNTVHEVDAPFGPGTIDHKVLKTSILPTFEGTDAQEEANKDAQDELILDLDLE